MYVNPFIPLNCFHYNIVEIAHDQNKSNMEDYMTGLVSEYTDK